MTIRGAVSGRMKTTLACVVESRASGQAAVWGTFDLVVGSFEARPDVACMRCVRVVVAMMSTVVWLGVAEC
jgi:hypothetical protein